MVEVEVEQPPYVKNLPGMLKESEFEKWSLGLISSDPDKPQHVLKGVSPNPKGTKARAKYKQDAVARAIE